MCRFDFVVCTKRDLRVVVADFAATHVISIVDPGVEQVTPAGIDPSCHLVLQCEDTEDSDWDAGPSLEQVARLLSFGREIPDHAVLVVHCHAGISRSPAALLAILAQEEMRSPDGCRRAMRMVRAVRPQASPNRLIAWHADQLLGCSGRLLEEAERLAAWSHQAQFGMSLPRFEAPLVVPSGP